LFWRSRRPSFLPFWASTNPILETGTIGPLRKSMKHTCIVLLSKKKKRFTGVHKLLREKEKKEEENKQPSLALSPSFYTKSFLPKVPAFLPASFHPSVALLLAFLCLIKSRILYHNS